MIPATKPQEQPVCVDDTTHHLVCILGELQRDGIPISDLDILYAKRRSVQMSFLQNDLNSLGKWFLLCLEEGYNRPPTGFSMKGKYPSFLNGIFRLLDTPGCITPDHVRAVRQICRLASKLNTPTDTTVIQRAFDKFVRVDSEVCNDVSKLSSRLIDRAKLIVWDVLGIDLTSREVMERGKHGPGAVYERLRSYDKWVAHNLCDWAHSPVGTQEPSRAVAVPKDCNGPRLIFIEPAIQQFRQQAIMSAIVDRCESRWSPAYRRINFTDQTVNQRMAKRSSKDLSYTTIDLSDASDRVSQGLVSALFEYLPSFKGYLNLTRPVSCVVPNHGTIRLNKFATMGCATTFPVQAVVFYAIACAAISLASKEQSHEVRARQRVYVYGDDIIVPKYYARLVCSALEHVGLKVNRSKTFSNSFFRESCGSEWFQGKDVRPVYLREPEGSGSASPKSIVSYLDTLSQLASRNWMFACDELTGLAARLQQSRNAAFVAIPRDSNYETAGMSVRVGYHAWAYLQECGWDDAGPCLVPPGYILRYNPSLQAYMVRNCHVRENRLKESDELIIRPLHSSGGVRVDSYYPDGPLWTVGVARYFSALTRSSSVKQGSAGLSIKTGWMVL